MTTAPATLPAAVWTDNAKKVAEQRYLMRGLDGELTETVEGMLWRTATFVAGAELEEYAEKWAFAYYLEMANCRFLPNSPTLMNAGTGNGHQLSACYVLPVEDSLDGITSAIKWQAKVLASGGGTGFSFSRLRPKGSPVGTTQGVAGGPVSFLRQFDVMSENIKQGGKRAGANMGILRVDHPDIMEFIRCKLTGGITNFNISVGITDAFMRALFGGDDYYLRDPRTGDHIPAPEGVLDAREVFAAIVEAAHRSGDPGLVFLDRINQSTANPVPDLHTIEATNPCGEQPLAPFDACNLGSINLSKFVVPGAAFIRGEFDYGALRNTVRIAVRFLDDVITVNPYPLPEIHDMVHSLRRIGLGVMGWADALFMLGVPYNSERAVELGATVMRVITDEAKSASEELAKTRGAFPLWDQSIYRDGKPVRNAARTTIAPTGSISILAGCSSGIEPEFAMAYHHKMYDRLHDDWIPIPLLNPVFDARLSELHMTDPDFKERLADVGILSLMPDVLPDDLRRVFVTAHEVAPEWHVRMQAAFQSHTDNGVSKTVNLPNSASVADIDTIYRMAWDTGCMGITVYRTGSKDEEVIIVGKGKEAQPTFEGDLPISSGVRSHPDVLDSRTYRVESPLGTVFVTVGSDHDGPLAVFVKTSKAGTETMAESEAFGRVISAVLRIPSPMDPVDRLEMVRQQLDGIGGDRVVGIGPEQVRSLPDAIARALLQEGQRLRPERPPVALRMATAIDIAAACPECGHSTYVWEEGCHKCRHCGYSQC